MIQSCCSCKTLSNILLSYQTLFLGNSSFPLYVILKNFFGYLDFIVLFPFVTAPALPRFRVSQVHENHVNLTWSSPRKQDLHYYLQYREIGNICRLFILNFWTFLTCRLLHFVYRIVYQVNKWMHGICKSDIYLSFDLLADITFCYESCKDNK